MKRHLFMGDGVHVCVPEKGDEAASVGKLVIWHLFLTLTSHPTPINSWLLHQLDTSILDVVYKFSKIVIWPLLIFSINICPQVNWISGKFLYVPLDTLHRCHGVVKIWSRGGVQETKINTKIRYLTIILFSNKGSNCSHNKNFQVV